MSWLLQQKNNKYRFWSTNTDRWLTGFLSREEALDYIRLSKLDRIAEEMANETANFPKGWTDKDTFKLF